REINRDDILRLMEIKMGRILKFNNKKAEERITKMKGEVKQINKNLKNIIEYTCQWFEELKSKYGATYPRKTRIRNFETIEAAKVVEASEKLYFSKEDGFVGTNIKNAEFIAPCSSLDSMIIFYKTGKYIVTGVSDKKFVGKGVIYLAIFKKHDKRTIYNVVYLDGETGISRIKRFNVISATHDKEYDLTRGTKGSKVTYFTANPNGEAEIIRVVLKPVPNLRKDTFEEDFSDVMIKGRNSMGNMLTKLGVLRITLKQHGTSTLGGRKIWYDSDVQRINAESRGRFLGEFSGDENILVITTTGEFYTTSYELTNHYGANILRIEKFDESKIWTVVFKNADKGNYYYLKRFRFDQLRNTNSFLGSNEGNQLIHITDTPHTRFLVRFGGADSFREDLSIDVDDFITIKGFKAVGKRITTFQVDGIEELEPLIIDEPDDTEEPDDSEELIEDSYSDDEANEDASDSLFGSDAFDD
ncbi:MAG: DNA gyrase/topoisomerase IV subunit A, partial [Bacteroidaceae bacterium]